MGNAETGEGAKLSLRKGMGEMVRLVGDEFKTATAQIGVSVYCPTY